MTAALQVLHRFHGLHPEGRGSALPYPAYAGTFTARQASLDAADRSVAPPKGLLTLHFRRRAFPPGAGSLLPGPLAVTRTGLTPAGDDELQNKSGHVTIGVTPSRSLGVLPSLVEVEAAVPRLTPALR